jgi:4'-phosphopantetheinyl transferase
MVNVGFVDTARLRWDDISSFLDNFPSTFKHKNERFRRTGDRINHLVAALAIRSMLNSLHIHHETQDFQYDAFGRPSLNFGGDFNISHSDGIVCCAVTTNGRVGIDVEKISSIEFESLTNAISCKELQCIKASADPLRSFYKLWTIKESALKADGRGLSISPLDLQITPGHVLIGNKEWYYNALDVDTTYAAHVVSEVENFSYHTQRLTFADILVL